MPRVQIWAFQCSRCEHVWTPIVLDPAPSVCPKCKTPYWNRSRLQDVGDKNRVVSKWAAEQLDGKTVRFSFKQGRMSFEGVGWFRAASLGSNTCQISIIKAQLPDEQPRDPILLTQKEVDLIESADGKVRFACVAHS